MLSRTSVTSSQPGSLQPQPVSPSPASVSDQRHTRVESNKISSSEGEDIWISLGSKIGIYLTDMLPSWMVLQVIKKDVAGWAPQLVIVHVSQRSQ